MAITNISLGQITLSEYYDTIFQYCDTTNFGWYLSERPMANGEVLQIYLGPLDEELEGKYIEKNMWGTFSGTWGYDVTFLDSTTSNSQNNRTWKCKVHIDLDDTVISQNQLYYDGDEKYPCWWKTMYFYSKKDTSTNHYVEMRDRTGELVPLYFVKIKDANHKIIYYKDQYCDPVPRCIIPPGAKYIYVSGYDSNVASGDCVYNPDGGDVTFVILPTANDHSLLINNKNRLEYHPLDSQCEPDSKNVINLLFSK